MIISETENEKWILPVMLSEVCVPSPAFGEGTQGAQQGGAKAPCSVV